MNEKPDPKVIRPLPDRCQMHSKTLFVPAKPEGYPYHIWICVVCVREGYWNEDITGKIKAAWPEEYRLGPEALREHLKKEQAGAKRKGATGV